MVYSATSPYGDRVAEFWTEFLLDDDAQARVAQ